MMKNMIIQTNDNTNVPINDNLIKRSLTLKDIINLSLEDEDTITIPLSTISNDILNAIIEYCDYICNEPITEEGDLNDPKFENIKRFGEREKYAHREFTQWELEFLNKYCDTKDKLFDLMICADFLHTKELLYLCIKYTASIVEDLYYRKGEQSCQNIVEYFEFQK